MTTTLPTRRYVLRIREGMGYYLVMAKNLLPTPTAANVLAVWETATAEQRATGLAWYSDARIIADALAARYSILEASACGILAALSPLNSWGANVNLAGRFLEAGGLTEGYLSLGLGKAQRILNGEDPRTVLASKTHFKVPSFFECILSAGMTDAVCVDRHGYSIAVGERVINTPSLTGKRYRTLAAAYVDAASTLPGVTPAQVQAVTWTVWRQRFWAIGAFDIKEL